MGDVRRPFVTPGGNARRFVGGDSDARFERRFAGMQDEQLRAGRIEDEDRSGRRHGEIDEPDRFAIGRHRERLQRTTRDQLQSVKRSGARIGARHPQVSTLLVDFDRGNLVKPG